MTSAVGLHQITKQFGTFTALSDVSFEIADNEFFTLLGPSGCGKTTLLRMIAGFEAASAGRIDLYGTPIGALPPDKRPVNTVFQNYALFPHMDVAQNIGFGLSMLGWAKADVTARVAQMLGMVQLEAFAHRKPHALSGGQQQRVALARAMAPRPKVLLLDEPLSALDLKLRQGMRAELKRLQRETGITFVFVTHDQEEALAMSDRIAVMSAGKVQQIGTPEEIYQAPENRFVADFIGETNLIPATVSGNEAGLVCQMSGGTSVHAMATGTPPVGAQGMLSIRPEALQLGRKPSGGDQLEGTLQGLTYLGTDTQFEVALATGQSVQVRQQNTAPSGQMPAPGDPVFVSITPGTARFLVT
ncbi:MAG: ABC transporter ATP-binding protein [Pseudomonadota bacterium]